MREWMKMHNDNLKLGSLYSFPTTVVVVNCKVHGLGVMHNFGNVKCIKFLWLSFEKGNHTLCEMYHKNEHTRVLTFYI
jgi:hypothetical protein